MGKTLYEGKYPNMNGTVEMSDFAAAGIKPGDTIKVTAKDGKIVIKKIKSKHDVATEVRDNSDLSAEDGYAYTFEVDSDKGITVCAVCDTETGDMAIGKSVCSPEDEYDLNIGLAIAWLRAVEQLPGVYLDEWEQDALDMLVQ